jgi:hypothetical protein
MCIERLPVDPKVGGLVIPSLRKADFKRVLNRDDQDMLVHMTAINE